MSVVTQIQPALTLVDDDFHSARLLSKMIEAHSGPVPEVIASPAEAEERLAGLAATLPANARHLVIVDLKASSGATRDFVARLHAVAPQLEIIAMSPTLDREIRNGLLLAGATAVFERHADINLYRREAASIVSFWVRTQHLDAVGT